MDMAEALRCLESEETAALLNVASGDRVFLAALEAMEATQVLVKAASQNEGAAGDLLLRLLDLQEQPHDPEYEHPYDVAIAAMLWILVKGHHLDYANLAAELLGEGSEFWWARRVSDLTSKATIQAGTSSGSQDVRVRPTALVHDIPVARVAGTGGNALLALAAAGLLSAAVTSGTHRNLDETRGHQVALEDRVRGAL